jgi:hypothetical protein
LVDSYLEGKSLGQTVVKLPYVTNGVLAGLVAVTAGCAVVEPYGACIIGAGASFIYVFASKFLRYKGLDDVVDAVPVHGCCGSYGVIMAALLGTKANYVAAYGIYEGAEDTCAGLFYTGKANGLGAAIVFLLFVITWTGFWCVLLFGGLYKLDLLRVSEWVEDVGLDIAEHGADTCAAGMVDLDKAAPKKLRLRSMVRVTPEERQSFHIAENGADTGGAADNPREFENVKVREVKRKSMLLMNADVQKGLENIAEVGSTPLELLTTPGNSKM